MISTPQRTFAAGLALAFGAACSCSESPPDVPGAALDLLARRPDAVVEQPGVILPQDDYPGACTFGASEGPGWSQTARFLADGRRYRETNQPVASLLLPATQPVDRDIELALWCPRPATAQPGPLVILLNGVPLETDELRPGREPGLVRLHAPKPFWRRGENELEIQAHAEEIEGQRRWDTLALALVNYGTPALVTLDTAGRTARFVNGTGARYALELASAAEVRWTGTASGDGTLHVRTGTLSPVSGDLGQDLAPHASRARAGRVAGTLKLERRPGELRTLELEWDSPGDATLTLERLAVHEFSPRPRPPIVLVSIDTFAARHLSLHGYARKTSPVLDALQSEAVVFERCLANAPWTLPSYLSLMSGLYPRAHWVTVGFQPGADVTNLDWWQLAENRWTVAEALRARGYRTGAFVDTWWLSPMTHVNQGFDVYDGKAALERFEDTHAGIQLIVEKLVPEWLAQGSPGATDVPPFLFVHALDAHGPYWPDDAFRDAFSKDLPANRRLTPAGSYNETYRSIPDWMGKTLVPDATVPMPPELPLEDIVARYDETLLKVDAYLGKLFALLREKGLYDEAVIVITGDHGESFGPDVYGHGVMREDVLHVPLVVKLPHGEHGGLRVPSPVQLVDVYPTLLELAGAAPGSAGGQGRSLLRWLDPAPRASDEPVFSEGGHVEQYALTDGRWRLVEERPGSESGEAALLTHPRVPESWYAENCPELPARPLTEELLQELLTRPGFPERVRELRQLIAGPYYSLFDLEQDPEERHDLAASEPEVLARLKARLELEKARSLRARAQARATPALPLPEDALDALDGLGYGRKH